MRHRVEVHDHHGASMVWRNDIETYGHPHAAFVAQQEILTGYVNHPSIDWAHAEMRVFDGWSHAKRFPLRWPPGHPLAT